MRPFPFPWPILFELARPAVLGPKRASFVINLAPLRERIAAILGHGGQTLYLQLDGVEADRQPGVVWQVHVGLPEGAPADAQSPTFVGNVALFSTGIRTPAAHHYKPAHFAFAINRAVAAAIRAKQDGLTVSFEPHGILIDGKPSQPKVASPVTIGRVSLAVQTAERR